MVSVIVPVYNVEQYIERCILSICNQKYTDLDIILVDDGSTDCSGKICDAYMEKDKRVRVFHKDNGGLSEARNLGIDMAKGEYLAFVDSDDWLNPNFIQYLLNILIDTESDISQTDYLTVSSEKNVLQPVFNNENLTMYCQEDLENEEYHKFINISGTPIWNKIYKKYLFDEIRFPVGKIHEDTFVAWKLFYKAKKVVISNMYLYYYFQHENSIMHKPYSEKNIEVISAFKERTEYLYKINNMKAYELSVMDTYEYALYAKNRISRESDSHQLKCEIDNVLNNLQCIINDLGLKVTQDDNKYRLTSEFFSLVKPGSTVVIYGAGAVGRDCYEQLCDSDVVTIGLWVANNWSPCRRDGYNVYPIGELLSVEFDYILVAVRNAYTANEIKNNLMHWGVKKQKIICFCDLAY